MSTDWAEPPDEETTLCETCKKTMPDMGAALSWCSTECHEAWKEQNKDKPGANIKRIPVPPEEA